MRQKLEQLKKELEGSQIHGSNIVAKIENKKIHPKYSRRRLLKLIKDYRRWKARNEALLGYSNDIIKERVKILNRYKNQIRDIKYSAQSKFQSTVLEEFLYYLFRDLLNKLNQKICDNNIDKKILLGGIKAYSNLYFAPENIKSFLKTPSIKINEKNQDFAIYRLLILKVDDEEAPINVPVVSIECKTYLDKTMLEGSIATAEKIKNGNPYSLFLVVTEQYEVDLRVDPAYSRIDQIFVLKKKGKKNAPIHNDVVQDLFTFVKNHLGRDWSNIKKKLTEKGRII